MYRYSRRLLWLLFCAMTAVTLSVWGLQSISLAQGTLDDGPRIYLPLLFASSLIATPTATPTPLPTATFTPTPTPTLSPSPTPTPTATSGTPTCPLDNVTGSYLVETTNLAHNCPGVTIDPVPPSTALILQDGTALTLQTDAGDAGGTIDPQTGDFQVSVTLEASAGLCPFGCVNTTDGSFDLTHNPVTFAGTGRLRIKGPLGGTYCSVTYDIAGTRTSCVTTSASSDTGAPSVGWPVTVSWLLPAPDPAWRLP
ncbi:MAG TPA: hypothetical protein VM537_28340 [Anaerolineae bacterium]|nr:hypothetical protein [Anaerolineae bacterium]